MKPIRGPRNMITGDYRLLVRLDRNGFNKIPAQLSCADNVGDSERSKTTLLVLVKACPKKVLKTTKQAPARKEGRGV